MDVAHWASEASRHRARDDGVCVAANHDEFFAQCDVVSLHLRLLDATSGIVTVRRRRRDLALLKALGLTQRQLASVVAWQSTVAALFAIIFGIPLGIVIDRQLWTLYARSIYAVPDPTVPLWPVVLTGCGALLFANLVAVPPGRNASRTPTALVLRAE